LTLSAKGLRGEIVLHMAEDKGLLIGTGSACSSNSKTRYNKVVLAMGYSEQVADGAIRISFSVDTTEAEVEAAAAILTAVVNELRTRMNIA
jgi:cysteine desulfurase